MFKGGILILSFLFSPSVHAKDVWHSTSGARISIHRDGHIHQSGCGHSKIMTSQWFMHHGVKYMTVWVRVTEADRNRCLPTGMHRCRMLISSTGVLDFFCSGHDFNYLYRFKQ